MTTFASIVLDSEGLSGWVRNDRSIMAVLHELQLQGSTFVVSANTIIEVSHPRGDLRRLDWLLSRVRVEPITKESARRSAALLAAAGMHGHRHAIDATVADAALQATAPAALLTSDPKDLNRLCGHRVHVIGV